MFHVYMQKNISDPRTAPLYKYPQDTSVIQTVNISAVYI